MDGEDEGEEEDGEEEGEEEEGEDEDSEEDDEEGGEEEEDGNSKHVSALIRCQTWHSSSHTPHWNPTKTSEALLTFHPHFFIMETEAEGVHWSTFTRRSGRAKVWTQVCLI